MLFANKLPSFGQTASLACLSHWIPNKSHDLLPQLIKEYSTKKTMDSRRKRIYRRHHDDDLRLILRDTFRPISPFSDTLSFTAVRNLLFFFLLRAKYCERRSILSLFLLFLFSSLMPRSRVFVIMPDLRCFHDFILFNTVNTEHLSS